MTVTITTSEGKKKVKVPESWEDVTTDQYQRLHSDWDSENIVQLFSILTGESYKGLYESKNKELESSLYHCVSFVLETQFKFVKVPKEIKLHGRAIKIPKNVGSLSIGQNIHVREKLEKCKVIDEAISVAISVYLQPLYDRAPFDFERAMEFHDEVLKMPITETYPIGFFLLSHATRDGRTILKRWLHTFIRYFRAMLKSVSTWPRLRKQTDLNHLNT